MCHTIGIVDLYSNVLKYFSLIQYVRTGKHQTFKPLVPLFFAENTI